MRPETIAHHMNGGVNSSVVPRFRWVFPEVDQLPSNEVWAPNDVDDLRAGRYGAGPGEDPPITLAQGVGVPSPTKPHAPRQRARPFYGLMLEGGQKVASIEWIPYSGSGCCQRRAAMEF